MNAIDTNVLVYALTPDEPARSAVAAKLVQELSENETVVLWQVACEFGAVISGLVARGKADPGVLDAMTGLRARFPIILPTQGILENGLRIHRDHRVSYWDAMLLAACADAGCPACTRRTSPVSP